MRTLNTSKIIGEDFRGLGGNRARLKPLTF
jgi:hypothetical protein